MSQLTAAKSGTFKIGGDIEINRLGFGAMRIRRWIRKARSMASSRFFEKKRRKKLLLIWGMGCGLASALGSEYEAFLASFGTLCHLRLQN